MEFIPDNPQHEQYVANLINSLIQEIENKAASVSDSELFLNKFKLMEAAKTFKQRHRFVEFRYLYFIKFKGN